MTKTRLFRLWLALGSVFMILLIIVYWDSVGTAHFYLLLRDFCANASFAFPAKERSFDDIPNYELNHLIVDDRHGVIYCYVPKAACTNWKRVMIVLSGSLLDRGAPYRDPLDIPREFVHNSSTHLTFNKFWRRYGKFSRHLMKVKLKKYTKFLFVRDPFVRLISAFRSKFELENEEFYRKFAVPIEKSTE
ncbi:PREDICTED: carbohydrate sulfotransferase 12 [Myotis brandtii]|uniref:carbohydrate sulfotransferase 12 n=1 Tax=Myotis brandtii TaxID=109478 RepID=UPI0007040DAF|nr:PREDICTED: carbohydrate sulfotransferase 12 [Myotis brandtii]